MPASRRPTPAISVRRPPRWPRAGSPLRNHVPWHVPIVVWGGRISDGRLRLPNWPAASRARSTRRLRPQAPILPRSKTPPEAPLTDRTSSLYSYNDTLSSKVLFERVFQSVGCSQAMIRFGGSSECRGQDRAEPESRSAVSTRKVGRPWQVTRHARSPSDKPRLAASRREAAQPRTQERHRMARARPNELVPFQRRPTRSASPLWSGANARSSVTLTARMESIGRRLAKGLSPGLMERGGDGRRTMPRT